MPDMQQILNFVFTIGIPVAVLLSFILANAMYLQLMERKVLAHMQSRLGPMRTGWHGILQPVADGLKLFFKEELAPRDANLLAFFAAPVLAITAAFTAVAVVPYGSPLTQPAWGFLPEWAQGRPSRCRSPTSTWEAG